MPFDLTTLDEPLKTLAAYDWGADAAPFKAIDAAVIEIEGGSSVHKPPFFARFLRKSHLKILKVKALPMRFAHWHFMLE